MTKKQDIFAAARQVIGEGIVRRYFDTPESYVKKDELWTLCPFRGDSKVGSFRINLTTGAWQDYALHDGGKKCTGGDFIELVSRAYSIKIREAAEKILRDTGGEIPESKPRKQAQRPEAITPIPHDKLATITEHVGSTWHRENVGEAVKAWRYPKTGACDFVVVRFNKGEDKQVLPFSWTAKGWKQMLPYQKNVPLHHDDLEDYDGPILIVEGEKCADVKVDGWLIATWQGGTNGWSRADWSQIKGRDVYAWPDNDEPGIACMAAIRDAVLPDLKILRIDDRPAKWDIADAAEEGIDLAQFIRECPIVEYGNDDSENEAETESELPALESVPAPFHFLGYTEKEHWFLPLDAPSPYSIPRGSIGQKRLAEIAPLAWWAAMFPQKRGIDWECACDWVITESKKRGLFMQDRIRGAGVWREGDEIVVNDGENVILENGTTVKYQHYQPKGRHVYIESVNRMGDLTGEAATVDDGHALLKFAMSAGFETTLQSLACLGWSLIAPFAGILSYRPHIWITGQSMAGKSWIIDNLVAPLSGDFSVTMNGRSTEAGVRRDLNRDAMVARGDEMEPKSESDRRNLENLVKLAVNASVDTSSKIVMSNSSSTVDTFYIHSCFMFASIVPYLSGKATTSRFTVCRVLRGTDVQARRAELKKMIIAGVIKNPERYRRRMFNNLRTILESIAVIRAEIVALTGDNRQGDQLAPMLAACHALISDKVIDKTSFLISRLPEMIGDIETTDDSDEDSLLRDIFEQNVRVGSDNINLGKIIHAVANDDDQHANTLEMYGMKIVKAHDIGRSLAIAYNNKALREILRDSFYVANYGEVLKRHECAASQLKSVRFSSGTTKCVLLSWAQLKNLYFDEPVEKVVQLNIPA